MKSHKVKFKQDNMLCHRCVMNTVKALSQLREIDELSVDFGSKMVKVIYRDDNTSREIWLIAALFRDERGYYKSQ